LETHAKIELIAIVINNTMLQLTHAQTAQLVNYQLVLAMEVDSTMVFAEPLLKLVIEMVKYNSHNNNAINAKSAQSDKYLDQDKINAISHHQLAYATNSSTIRINAKTVQLDNWLIKARDNVLPESIIAILLTKLLDLKNHASNVSLVELIKFQIIKELLVFQDQSQYADASLEDKDINAFNAQLDRFQLRTLVVFQELVVLL
jgi:hypothetical protein